MSSTRYILITPVKDEAKHIELVLRSVTRQRLQPLRWIIVDDGSSDGTPAIVERYLADFPFITLLRKDVATPRNTGSAEIHAFNRGYDQIRGLDFDFVVKLDGDLSFESDYFEKLIGHMTADSSLGIASGVYLEEDKAGTWRVVGMPTYHAFGACKVVRRECFEAINGFVTTPGWDTVDQIHAWTHGWTTTHFDDLEVKHHKPEGSGMGMLKTSRMHGRIHYVTGGDPLFFVFKALHRARLRPFVFGALALTAGYLEAVVRQTPRLVTDGEAATYRHIMRQRLRRLAIQPRQSAAEYRT